MEEILTRFERPIMSANEDAENALSLDAPTPKENSDVMVVVQINPSKEFGTENGESAQRHSGRHGKRGVCENRNHFRSPYSYVNTTNSCPNMAALTRTRLNSSSKTGIRTNRWYLRTHVRFEIFHVTLALFK